ncbi:hypothetical protein ACVIVD_004277 [Bradyrhizobium liaoningense]
MRTLVEPGAIRQPDPPAGQVTDDGLHRARRIIRKRIEPEDRLRGRGIELLLRADDEAERILDSGQQLLETPVLSRVRVEQQQPSIGMTPAAHVGHDEQVAAGHLDDRTRKFEMILFAGDEPGAESLLHVDLNPGKSEIAAAANVRADRIAALPDRLGRSRGEGEQRAGDGRRKHAQASAFAQECELVHGAPDLPGKLVPCRRNAVQLIITRL